ncbi:multiple inositol polyphosphate phosphatase 1-like [Danaus plexippus]|uniref:multiple inositol polyphosphate phosphatase 1-like n=2 Tax=Danaus plexippus TaxID=13037 RepID=UPI002AB059FD|nr:multiple inositol polyphosphate phosphatase 1-like [Danaus plexippus]
MLLIISLLFMSSVVVSKDECYWNRQCKYQLFSTTTPYDIVRGDIRDQPNPDGCKVVSLWSIHRHGNRHPGSRVVKDTNELWVKLRDQIIRSEAESRNSLCSQDLEDILNWKWDSSLETTPSYLTQVGNDEIYSIGKRVAKKYSELMHERIDRYYFRGTNEQRTKASVLAYVNGLTHGSDMNLTSRIEESRERDDTIRPYENCDRYQESVKNGSLLPDQLAEYDQSPEYLAVRDRVFKRLGITNDTEEINVFNLYELCRFYRTWSPNLQCPWCSLFSDEDLVVLEYRDDVRHYYKNGYGFDINADLGTLPLRDLFENFELVTRGEGKNIVSYFTHDTMMEMMFCALGLYKDKSVIKGSSRNPDRLWRTSYIASFSTNFIAVLHRCDSDTHRVQLFINEKPTSLCPVEGCSWSEFVETFQRFSNSSLAFCTNRHSDVDEDSNNLSNTITVSKFLTSLLILLPLVLSAN